jgi:nitrile hydratase
MKTRFTPGSAVRVADRPATGHVRTPAYIRGKRGRIERICGAFKNPEELAYGHWEGESIALYRVRFAQSEVWPDYDGPAHDAIEIEIYEHWLEPEES